LSYFSRYSRTMPEENKKQAMCIEGGELIPNPNGTAPGQYIFAESVHYFLLPGPPMEMRPMFQAWVLPKLREIFAVNQQVLVSRILHFYGIGESTVDEQIVDLTTGVNPTVAPYASEGEMVLRISATASNTEGAQNRIAPVEAEIRKRFGEFIYGVDKDTLPSVVASVLTQKKATLAVAESCTGGLVQQLLTDLPGASSYLLGGIVSYDNRIKHELLGVPEEILTMEGAVSESTAKWMAEGVRKKLKSTYGISVTGIAGPDGGTPEKPVGLAYVAVAGPTRTEVFRVHQRGSREQIRIRVAKHLLWRLWRHVSE
jgi:nicotinamide-nucleotide amidase